MSADHDDDCDEDGDEDSAVERVQMKRALIHVKIIKLS